MHHGTDTDGFAAQFAYKAATIGHPEKARVTRPLAV